MSTGDRTILGRISKRGNRYLRTLFMQGARVILLRPKNWTKHSFGPWLEAATKRLHHNVLATALANKLARIAWTVLVQARSYGGSSTFRLRPRRHGPVRLAQEAEERRSYGRLRFGKRLLRSASSCDD